MKKKSLSEGQKRAQQLFFLAGILTNLATLQDQVPQKARQAILDARRELETAVDWIRIKS